MLDHREYESWHAERAEAESANEVSLGPWHHTALKLLPSLDNKQILEIGCGRGDFALLLARRFPSSLVTAIDFSNVAIDVARAKCTRADANVKFEPGDATQLNFADLSFDYIISCECLEHIPQPATMAAEIARVLKFGGGFLLTTENYLNGLLLAWLRSWLRGRAIQFRLRRATTRKFLPLLAGAQTSNVRGVAC